MISDEVIELQKLFYQTHDYLDSKKKDKILILGIGNYLMGDEGVGVHTIHALSKVELPENVDIIDGGTGSFDLMPILSQYPLVIFVDATMDSKPAGTINVIYPKFAKDFPRSLSTHELGLKDMIESAILLGKVPEIFLIVVSINPEQEMNIELTPGIKQAIPDVIETVQRVVSELE